MISHRASRIRSMIAVARNDGRRRSNFGPRRRRSTSFAAQAIGHSGDCGSGIGSVSAMCPYENKTSASDWRWYRRTLPTNARNVGVPVGVLIEVAETAQSANLLK
jgi:hypothetical protein